jgi:branched-chain amino acid aminotransferase
MVSIFNAPCILKKDAPTVSPSSTVYFRKQFLPSEQATLTIQNHAFLYGTSLFEGIRGYWVPEQNAISIFRAKEHFERLLSNCRIFCMDPQHSLDDMMRVVSELVAKNAPKVDTYIRPTVFKDIEAIGPSLLKGEDTFSIFTTPLGAYIDIEKGLHVTVSNWRRLSDNAIPPRAKAGGAYMNTALVVSEARRNGFDDAIVLTNEGNVSEGSAMNFFMVRNGVLITPAITEDILEGVTRNTIIQLAQEQFGLQVQERPVDRTELYIADEAFFCGTGAQVAPITKIDHRPVGDGKLGPITTQLQNLYFDVVKNRLPQYADWCTVVPIQV